MTVLEETWVAEGDVIDGHAFGPWRIWSDRGWTVGVIGDGCSAPAEARLCAAAPDMARALLAVEWAGRAGPAGDVDGACVSCGANRPAPHSPDCEVDAALRKAGIR